MNTEESTQTSKQSLDQEFCLEIPCVIKHTGQPEQLGIIQQDLGDSFVVYLKSSNSTITVPKILVFPDFPQSVGQITKCSSKTNPPSTKFNGKTRRQKGEGSGHIYYRTVTRNGKEYEQVYYQWRENGKQKTKYIPLRLLDKVTEAEALKLPVADIICLLGDTDKCSSKVSKILEEKDKCSSNSSDLFISPSKKRRPKGDGTGLLFEKPVTRNGKQYSQWWYQWHIKQRGEWIKRTKYVPKKLVGNIKRLEQQKAPVREILALLRVRF